MSQFIKDFRQTNPQYNDMADDQLVSALHRKYYSDMDAEAFNQKIGYQSIAEEPIEQAQAAESQVEAIPQQEAIDPMQAAEPSMLDLVGSKLSELSADPVPNAFKGAIERTGDIAAGFLTSVNVAAKAGEEALGLGGLVWDGGVLPSYKGPEEYQAYLQQGGKDILAESEESAKGLQAGYVPTHTWEEVKREFSEGGALSGSAWGEVVGYIGEQGIKSVPDMAAALLNLPAYIIARSGEIGEARANNKGKEGTDLIDVVEAAPFAVGSALLERIGAKGITQAGAESFGKEALKKGFAEAAKRTAKAGGKAASKEAVTEAIQEGMIEYAGERLGTNAKMTLKESLDLAAAGAVAGGGMGGAAGTVSAGYKEATYNAEAELGKALGDFIDQSRFEIDQKSIAGQFDPANAQLEVRPEPQAIAEPKAQKPLEVTGEFEGVQPQGEFVAGMPESTPAVYDIPDEPKAEAKPEEKAEPKQQGQIKGLAVVEAPIDEVTLSSDVPQFKEGANASGVVEPLGGKFERTGVAPIQIWVRKDGRKEVISGRHRLDLAKRSGETTIPAQYHYESEGFDVEQAASLDAILNIREGQGKVKDYVEFIQATKPTEAEAAAQGILARQTGKRAFTIADSGSDTLITSHRANQISDEAATRIARAAPKNDALQSVGIKAIQDGKTIIMAENLVKAVGSMTTDKQQATDDLFGFDDSAMKEAVELAKKVGKKQAEIQRTLSAVTGAAKNPELARKEGVDVKDPEGIKKKIKQLKTKKKAWDNWHTNPKLMEQLKGKKPTASKTETVVGLPQVDADRLIASVKKGDLGVSRTNAIIKDIYDAVNGKEISIKRQLESLAELNNEEQLAAEEETKAKAATKEKADLVASKKEQQRERILGGDFKGLQSNYSDWLKSLSDTKRQELFAKGASAVKANAEFMSYKPDFDLAQQTEADIRAEEEKQTKAKQDDKAAADKVEADKQVNDFVLAGSDSATDQAEARGQNNLFDTPAEPKKPATAQQIQKLTDIANDFNRGLDNVNKTVARKAKDGKFISSDEAKAAIKQHEDYLTKRQEEANQANANEKERANKLYGDKTKNELLKKLDELQGSNYAGGEITDGKRSTKKAVTNEAARSNAEEAMKLERFIKNKFGELGGLFDVPAEPKAQQQTDSSIEIKRDGKTVASVDYSVFEGIPAVKMINTDPDYQRQGLATEALIKLQAKFPDAEIDLGSLTGDGAKLIDSLEYSVIGSDTYDSVLEKLEETEVKLEEYKELAEKFNFTVATEAERLEYRESTKDWDDLHDIKYDLENELAELEPSKKIIIGKKKKAEPQAKKEPVVSSKKETTTPKADGPVIDYATNAIEGFNQFRELTGEGKATKADIQKSFDSLVENKEAVLAQLNKLTKAKLLRYVGRGDLKKPAMVDSAYKTMLSAHVFGDMVMTIFGGSKTYDEQIAEKVAAQTQEQIETDYERQREARAEREKQKESFVKSLTNPETLAEYKEFIRVQGKGKLSAEQLKAYDTLVADSMLEEDKAKPKTVQGEAEAVETTRAETTHAKKGHQLFVVSLVNRVSKEQYKELNNKAKEFGGYYSAYNKAGAIPGFQFKTIEEADQFEQVLKGKDTDKSDFEEAKADVKNTKQADKLMEMADKLEAKGNESLGQDRQTNTGKRAAQAASASEKAYKQIATAQTVKQIATKMAAGEIVYLGKMTQITQLEELKAIQRKAVPSSMMHSEYDGYSISNSMKEGVTVEDYINNVRMPELFIDKERAKRFSDKLDGVKGFSRFAAELKKLPMAEGKVHLGRLTKDQVKKIHDAVKGLSTVWISLALKPMSNYEQPFVNLIR